MTLQNLKGSTIYIICMEERYIHLLKSLKIQNQFLEDNYDNFYPSGSKPGILYWLDKIRKVLEEGITTFCPFFSAIAPPTYKLAKICDKLLKLITTNKYTLKDSFSFAKEVEEFDPNFVLASFDVKPLFTNIPLIEIVVLCVENPCRNQKHIANLSKNYFRSLIKMTMFEWLLSFFFL